MPLPLEKRLFRTIDTHAVRANGMIVTARYIYPAGAPYSEYRRIDDALVRAFGSDGSRTVGAFMDEHPSV